MTDADGERWLCHTDDHSCYKAEQADELLKRDWADVWDVLPDAPPLVLHPYNREVIVLGRWHVPYAPVHGWSPWVGRLACRLAWSLQGLAHRGPTSVRWYRWGPYRWAILIQEWGERREWGERYER
jgi:hypothetical protein